MSKKKDFGISNASLNNNLDQNFTEETITSKFIPLKKVSIKNLNEIKADLELKKEKPPTKKSATLQEEPKEQVKSTQVSHIEVISPEQESTNINPSEPKRQTHQIIISNNTPEINYHETRIILREDWRPLIFGLEEAERNQQDKQFEVQNDLNTPLEMQEEETDEEVLKKILSQLKEEKEVFDSKLNSQNQGQPSHSLFNKIYKEEFEYEKEKATFLGKIFAVLNTNIVWQSVAFACVLGVILFYFQAFQPLALNNYINQTNAQARDIQVNYDSQTQNFFGLQKILTDRFIYTPTLLCSETPLYQDIIIDVENTMQLTVGTLPNKSLKDLDDYLIFSDSEIQNNFLRLYNNYEILITDYAENVEKLADIPSFLNYRNQWIETCKILEDDDTTFNNLRQACDSLQTKSQEYTTADLPFFWDDIKSDVEEGIQLCQNLTVQTQAEFRTSWIKVYTDIMEYKVDFEEVNSTLLTTNEKFIQELDIYSKSMDRIKSERDGLTEIWYLMDINL